VFWAVSETWDMSLRVQAPMPARRLTALAVVILVVLSPEVVDGEIWKGEGWGRVSEAQSPRLRRRKGSGVVGSGTMVVLLVMREVMMLYICEFKNATMEIVYIHIYVYMCFLWARRFVIVGVMMRLVTAMGFMCWILLLLFLRYKRPMPSRQAANACHESSSSCFFYISAQHCFITLTCSFISFQ